MAEDKQPSAIAVLSGEDVRRLGERMYREGVLPSGEPIQAVVQGDITVSGTAFTCVSCHQRSGLGSFEGGVLTLPTNGLNLYAPINRADNGLAPGSVPPLRPAYTDKSLAEALRTGEDPSGRLLLEAMPRYMLQDEDMAILISYLKSLSSQVSPGVSDTLIRFATVITDDVSPEERSATLLPLEKYFRSATAPPSQARTAESTAYKKLALSIWLLKGPPETWRGQLEEYYRKEQVFALVGGITKGEWQPVHKFSEDNHIPCILPITDFPVISETDWYTLYFSKGLYQEGEGAARYLNARDELKERSIVQIVRDSREGRALSSGFQGTLLGLGHKAPVTVTLKAGETLTGKILEQVLDRERPAALMIWDGPAALPGLEGLSAAKNRPKMVFVSSGYLQKSMWTLREQAREFTYVTYPLRLPQDPSIKSAKVGDNIQIIMKQSYSVTRVLSKALNDMRGQYYRDNLLDVMGMSTAGMGMVIMGMGSDMVPPDMTYPLYERFSFGPGQRYASKGCYIVQLKTELVKKSDWSEY